MKEEVASAAGGDGPQPNRSGGRPGIQIHFLTLLRLQFLLALTRVERSPALRKHRVHLPVQCSPNLDGIQASEQF